MGKLTAIAVKNSKKPGKFPDGDGLYLVVGPKGNRSWVFRFCLRERRREMGLGSAETVTLLEARNKAIECRRKLQSGDDPLEAKQLEDARQLAAKSKNVTFEVCARDYIKTQKYAWTNKRQAAIWVNSLEAYAFPIFGKLPVNEVTRHLIIHALKKIWEEVPDTARRVRNRIERIIGYATVMGYRVGENPARWKDNLDHALPLPPKTGESNHHSAVPVDDLPKFFAAIDRGGDTTHAALAFLILTAARTIEVIGAEWSEFDFKERTWIVPAVRMKARREHRVPLSDAAMAILEWRKTRSQNRFVFPGRIGGRHISNMAMLMIMRRLGRVEVPHGFRSTFKDWASEKTDCQNEVSEMALAHVVASKTEAAYRRGDLFDKRRSLMQEWANYCLGMPPSA